MILTTFKSQNNLNAMHAPSAFPANLPSLTSNLATAFAEGILRFLSEIPHSNEIANSDPRSRARQIAEQAAGRAALTAGGLALPPGPAGWLTILPEMIAVWKIQAQMVADIAGAFGRKTAMTREEMMFCLFRHVAAQAMRDLAVRVGSRILIKRATLRLVQQIAGAVGVRLTQRAISKAIGRFIPFVGAGAVAAYAWFDTHQVGRNAIDLFSSGGGSSPVEDPHPAKTEPTTGNAATSSKEFLDV